MPTKDELDALFAPQLLLEAAMAERGGFDKIDGKAETVHLSYWQANGLGDGGKVSEIKGSDELVAEMMALVEKMADAFRQSEHALSGAALAGLWPLFQRLRPSRAGRRMVDGGRGRRMSDVLDALALATGAQRRATTPDHSAWVEANAGTGKTKVLTDRVTRLLLDGVKPERILCLTFTKAAAAEMRNRLAHQLGRWALADEAKLDDGIAKLIDSAPDPAQRVVARRLFARVLDAPGGINILTIHAFCQALLKRFPLEAGVAPGFEILDEAEAQTILRRVQDEQMEALARNDASPALAEALATVANKVSIAEYAELMTRLLGERAWLLARIGDEAGLSRVRARLAKEMGCAPDDTAASLTESACLDAAFDAAALREAARALTSGGKQDKARSTVIAEWLAASDRATMLPTYAQRLLHRQGRDPARWRPRPPSPRCPASKTCCCARPSGWRRCCDRINGAALVERTLALLRLGLDVADRYTRAKRRRAVLDYDDLIVATRRLLESAESAAWVLFKLDGGIDHVLVDEAQDTNPDQWEVIRRLTEEFFVGEGAVGRSRTIFAVGDTKQSIFGFQRADPRKLKEMREWFDERSRIADRVFVPVELNVSFRSTPAVLDAVDWVFGEIEAAKGVAEPGDVIHLPSRKNEARPGRAVAAGRSQRGQGRHEGHRRRRQQRGAWPAARTAGRV